MVGSGKSMKKKVVIKEENLKKIMFHKLRKKLFREAYEFATLFAAQVLIILFSPEKKIYTFGYPSFDEVMKLYLNQKSVSKNDAPVEPQPRQSVQEIFINRVFKIFEMIRLGKRKEDISVLLKAPEGLSRDEYIELDRMVHQFIAVIDKKIVEKKNKEKEASKMMNNV